MQQVAQAHNQYLIDVQNILGAALLNKSHFFKPTNDFSEELAQLEKEQAQDLTSPELAWWEPKAITEEQYFKHLGCNHGHE